VFSFLTEINQETGMFKSIFRAIARALRGAAKYGLMLAEDIVMFPFRLLSFGHQARQEAADAQAQAERLEAENASLQQTLSKQQQQAPRREEPAYMDFLDRKAALVHLFSDAVVYGQRTPDISGMDVRTALWCEEMRHDKAAAKAVSDVSPASLALHICGGRTIKELHPWPEDRRIVAAASTEKSRLSDIEQDDEYEEPVLKFG
jgi:hypothetical protein